MMHRITAILCLVAAIPFARAADLTVPQNAQVCEACHGPHGQASDPILPSLAGQTSRYAFVELQDFATERRPSTTMGPIAKALSPQDMQVLAEYFGAQRPMSNSAASDAADVAHGKLIADDALCVMCHGTGLAGQNEVPRIAGQQPAYIVKALRSFRDGRRTNDGGAMQGVVRGMSDQDIDALAHYIANLD